MLFGMYWSRATTSGAYAAVLACLIPATVAAEPCASSAEGPSAGHTYGTELEAAVAAVGLYNPAAVLANREFMGAILKTGDCFTYTVSPGSRGANEVIVWVHVPGGAEIVGYWHADHSGAVRVMRPPGRVVVAR